jgi:phenylacetate-coenzyme A ligase PaaK-like adenylate-forming protein
VARGSGGRLRTDRLKIGLCQKGKVQNLSDAIIAALQRQRLRELIDHAGATVPSYRQLYRDLPVDRTDLRTLPPVSKSALLDTGGSVADSAISRAGIEAFMTLTAPGRQRHLDRSVVCKTSGSTGQPGVFVHDPAAMVMSSALLLARTLPARIGARGLSGFLRAGVWVALAVAPEG